MNKQITFVKKIYLKQNLRFSESQMNENIRAKFGPKKKLHDRILELQFSIISICIAQLDFSTFNRLELHMIGRPFLVLRMGCSILHVMVVPTIDEKKLMIVSISIRY